MGDIYDIRVIGPSPDDPSQIRAELTKIEAKPDPEPPQREKKLFACEHILTFEKGYLDSHEFNDESVLVLVDPGETVRIEHQSAPLRKGQNGWQIFYRADDLETRLQSYDPANYGNRPEYYFEPASEYLLEDGDTIVLAESHDAPGARPQLNAVCPVLFTESRAMFDSWKLSGVRDAYASGAAIYTSDPLPMPPAKFDVLPETPDPENFFDLPHGPNVYHDHVSGWLGRYSHPTADMPDYGREIAAQLGDLLCMCMTKFSLETRQRLWNRFRQIAIDLHGMWAQGTRWGADGGHGNGRLIPVLTQSPLTLEEQQTFSEVQQTYHEPILARADWRIRPGKEDPDWDAAYRQCCTFCAMSNHLLAARYWHELNQRILHVPLMNYMNFYANKPDSEFDNPKFHFWSDFARALWKKYA